MKTSENFIRYSLRNRLFVLAGATFFLCALVILLFFPLLNLTLSGLQNRTIGSMQEATEMEATTISRLLVLEFATIKGLLQVTPTSNTEMDQWIENLIWEKVTFNEIIEGVELIRGQQDAQGRHLTYMFYRREAPELEPMAGPRKLMKSFQGMEQDLINSIISQQRVDNTVQGSVNRGPKKEGEMLLRYMPVHVLSAEEGAVFWGVAKIGIDTSRMRQLLFLQNQEQTNIRRDIWVEITLSLLISGVLAMSLIYFWVRHITEPLRTLSMVTAALQGAKPEDFELWLENLKRVDAQGQAEVVIIQQVLERLGTAVPKLGQRLIDGEAQACLGKVIARGLPTYQAMQAQLQESEQKLGEGADTGAPLPSRQTLELMRVRQDMVLEDLSHLWSDPEGVWEQIDITPGIQRAWRLATLGLPAEVTMQQEFAPLPPVWGSAAKLSLAALYLLAFAVDLLPPAGELGIKAEPSPPGGGAPHGLGVRGPAHTLGVPGVVKSVRRSGPDPGKPGAGPGCGHRLPARRQSHRGAPGVRRRGLYPGFTSPAGRTS